jgi:hypothetical protein
MKQGISSREELRIKILSFASDLKEHNRSEFYRNFKNDSAKNTIYKYLDELTEENPSLIDVKPGTRKDLFKPIYLINEHGLKALRRTETKQNLADWVDSWPVERQEELNGVINRWIEKERLNFAIDLIRQISEEKEKLYRPLINKLGNVLAEKFRSLGINEGNELATTIVDFLSKVTFKD